MISYVETSGFRKLIYRAYPYSLILGRNLPFSVTLSKIISFCYDFSCNSKDPICKISSVAGYCLEFAITIMFAALFRQNVRLC
jgi:hypothetical protein